ncbi:MAG: peptide deformylase [Bacteroidaceae bacterium]|nr:peptide deformylase [Bacteroidaceae bacterium]
MILPIYIYGQPVLRQISKDVDIDNNREELSKLAADMFETLDRSTGIGLAAPQIGKSIRVVVIDLDIISEDMPEYKGFRHVFYNAHILETNDETESMDEGCLSLPGLSETVTRPTKIKVSYYDEDFQHHEEWVEGYLARVMQHEFDHLEGRLYIDHITAFRRKMIQGKLNNFLKGKARCSYKVKTVKA